MTVPDINKIANGANNVAGLKAFPDLAPPLFSAMPRTLRSEWHGFQGRQLTGARVDGTWGKPWAAWIFDVLSASEQSYIRAHFGTAVTIRTLNKETNAFANFNATLRQPDLGDPTWATWSRSFHWEKVRYEFIDLVVIP